MVTDVPVSIPNLRTAVFDLLHAISQKHDLHGWIEDCLVRVFKRYSPCENPFRMIVASLDVSEASGQARARIYPTDLQGDALPIHMPKRNRSFAFETSIHSMANATRFD